VSVCVCVTLDHATTKKGFQFSLWFCRSIVVVVILLVVFKEFFVGMCRPRCGGFSRERCRGGFSRVRLYLVLVVPRI
jgi:hypothetical protein